MFSPERDPNSVDLQQLPWEETPYPGVSIARIAEQLPLYTLMAVKVDPGSSIPLHRHNREPGWMETITFPKGGNFVIQRDDNLQAVSENAPVSLELGPGDAFGLTNNNLLAPLYFYSRMQPGFTGYAEIEEIS